MPDYGLNIQMRCSRPLEGRLKLNSKDSFLGSITLLIALQSGFIVGTLIIGCRVIARRHDDPAAQQAGMQGRAPLASGIPSTSYTEAGPTLLARARNDRMPTRSLSLLGATRTARTKIPITGKSALPPFAEESTHRRHSCLAPCGAPAATPPGETAIARKWQGVGNIRPPEKSPL
jgi:hypothetical protein